MRMPHIPLVATPCVTVLRHAASRPRVPCSPFPGRGATSERVDMARTVEKTRAGGTWSEARYWNFVVGVIRAGHKRWGPKHQAKKLARRHNQSANKRLTYESQCAKCKVWFREDETEVDHIIPCGSCTGPEDLIGYFERTYVEVDGYQVLCKPCHQEKTNAERAARRKRA